MAAAGVVVCEPQAPLSQLVEALSMPAPLETLSANSPVLKSLVATRWLAVAKTKSWWSRPEGMRSNPLAALLVPGRNVVQITSLFSFHFRLFAGNLMTFLRFFRFFYTGSYAGSPGLEKAHPSPHIGTWKNALRKGSPF